jgi:hypothetical protein
MVKMQMIYETVVLYVCYTIKEAWQKSKINV